MVDNALTRFYKKELSKTERRTKRKAKNNKPEFDFKKVAKDWLYNNGFSVNVVESKAVWNHQAGAFIRGQTDAGFSDIVGVTPVLGVACFIELKAPGKRSTLKDHQRDFLIEKIDKMAFSACTDSINHLESLFNKWKELFLSGLYMEAKNLLLKDLPVKKEKSISHVDDILF